MSDVLQPIWFPINKYHRNFYLLRLTISINNQPLLLKDADSTPSLFSESLNQNVSLSSLICQVTISITKYMFCINGVHFDGNCPLLVLGFLSEDEQLSKVLPQLARELNTDEIVLKLFNCSPDMVSTAASVFLCCPNKDKGATLIPLTTLSHYKKYQESFVFDFRKLFLKQNRTGHVSGDLAAVSNVNKAPNPDLDKLLPVMLKAADVWFRLGFFLGVPSNHLRVLGKQFGGDLYDCVTQMLVWLFSNNAGLTWDEVLSALCDVDRKDLAQELASKYSLKLPLAETVTDSSMYKELPRALQKAADCWFDLGACLDVPNHQLRRLKAQHSNLEDCMTHMLIWLLDNEQVTWDKVLGALCLIGREELARDISTSHGLSMPKVEKVEENSEKVVKEEKERTEIILTEAKSTEAAAKQDVEMIVNNQIPQLKVKIELLKTEKQTIEDLLEIERKECEQLSTECEDLHEKRKQHMVKIKTLEAALRAKDAHLRELEARIEEVELILEEKEASVEKLKTQLEEKEEEYQASQEKLSELAKTLSLRRVELREKSTVVQALESSLMRGNRNLDVENEAKKRVREQQERLAHVKQSSVRNYHSELLLLIDKELRDVVAQETTLSQMKSEISIVEAEIEELNSKLTEEEAICKEKEGMALIESEMCTATLELDLMKLREKCALSKIASGGINKDLQNRRQNIKNLEELLSTCGPISSVRFTWRQYGSEIPVHVRSQPVAVDGQIYSCTDSSVVLQYSPDSDECLILRPPPHVVDYTLSAHMGHLVVVGGFDYVAKKVTGKILMFSEKSGTWLQYCRDMPLGVTLPAVVGYKNWLIVASGLISDKPIQQVIALDKPTGTWITLKPLPYQGYYYQLSVIENTIYLAGGGQLSNKSTLYAYLPTLLSGVRHKEVWSSLPDKMFHMSSPVVSNSTLLAVGGTTDQDGDYVTTAVLLYDSEKGRWVKAGDLPKPMVSPSCIVLSGRLIVFNWKSAYIAKLDVTF